MTAISLFVTYKQFFTILHVLSVVVGMGAALVTDILFSFFASNKVLSSFEIKIVRWLSYVVTAALVCIVITGVCIFLSDPARYMASAKFLTKMTIVLILCVNGYLLHRFIFSRLRERGFLTSKKLLGLRKIAFCLGAISLTSWLSAMSLGVLDKISISYGQAISIYIGILIIAILTSQMLVKKI